MHTVINFFAMAGSSGPIAVPEPDYYRTALLVDATGQADGTGYAADESRHAHALTYNGNAAIASGKFEFDGTGDFISIPDTLLWTPGTSFTIECIGLVLDAVNTGTPQTIASHNSDDSGLIGWKLHESGGSLIFSISTSGTATTDTITIGTVTSATRYWFAVCWDGTTLYSVFDGAQGGSAAFSGVPFNSSQSLRLGASADSGAAYQFLDGRFECFVLTRGETLYASSGSYSEPTLPRDVDTPALTDADWADVVLLASYDPALARIRDFGPLDLPVTVNGNAAGDAGVTLGDGTQSIAFDGTGDYLSIPDSPILELGSGDFTIEVFARHADNTALRPYASKYQTTTQRSWLWAYRGDLATDILNLTRSSNGTGTTTGVPSAAFTPTLSTWYHTAVCRSGSNHRVFIDGTQSGATETTAVTLFNSTAALGIGIDNPSSPSYMNGHLAEVRITKAARYTTDFAGPTGAFPRG